jgi:hypothetical protein
MKRLFVSGLVLVIAVLIFRQCSRNSAEARYRAFAEEVLNRRYEAAAAMCDGLSVDDLRERGSQERIGAGPAMFQTLFPSRFEIGSSERTGDGSVVLKATQIVLFNPPGVESAIRPAMQARLNQEITLRKVSGAWKVTAFSNAFESMDSLTGR